MQLKTLAYLLGGLIAASTAFAGIAENIKRVKAAGVDVITYPMGVEDVVTIVGSIPAGDAFAAQNGGNIAAATLVGMLLDKGTARQDKFAIAKQLDDVGAQLGFQVGEQLLEIRARCLKKDVPLVIRLMAEQLRMPALSPEELAKSKKQFEASMRQAQEDTKYRADDAFRRAVYPEGHPNRWPDVKAWLAASDKLTVDELKAFHGKYYGPAGFTLVFVGDVDTRRIQKEVGKAFSGWTGGVDIERSAKGGAMSKPAEQAVALADKASVTVVLGQATGLRYQDPDTLALRVGTAILGSGFTGRLMSTVRDREGLTYGISAGVANDTFVDGVWSISAAFSPQLMDRGIAATRRELDKWWQGGVTAQELAERKTNMIGSYQVGLATTGGMAGVMLQTLHRGKPLSWLDDLPKAIDGLTVEQVNTAIKKYLDPSKMVLVKVGTLETRAAQAASAVP